MQLKVDFFFLKNCHEIVLMFDLLFWRKNKTKQSNLDLGKQTHKEMV